MADSNPASDRISRKSAIQGEVASLSRDEQAELFLQDNTSWSLQNLDLDAGEVSSALVNLVLENVGWDASWEDDGYGGLTTILMKLEEAHVRSTILTTTLAASMETDPDAVTAIVSSGTKTRATIVRAARTVAAAFDLKNMATTNALPVHTKPLKTLLAEFGARDGLRDIAPGDSKGKLALALRNEVIIPLNLHRHGEDAMIQCKRQDPVTGRWYFTRTWERYESLDNMVMSIFSPDADPEMYVTTLGGNRAAVVRECIENPMLIPVLPIDIHIVAFANGIFRDVVAGATKNTRPLRPVFFEYPADSAEAIAELGTGAVGVDMSHITFDRAWLTMPIDELPTPVFNTYGDQQGWSPAYRADVEFGLGRLLFPIKELDNYELAVNIVGPGGTGKSTLSEYVMAMAAPGMVAEIDQEVEPKFGLSMVLEPYSTMWVANEVDNEFSKYVSSSRFKQLVSGETVSLPVKGKPAKRFKPRAQALLLGNQMHGYQDLNSDQGRRNLIVNFPNFIKGAGDFVDHLMAETGVGRVRLVRRYLERVEEVGVAGNIWDRMSEDMASHRREMERENNRYTEFMDDHDSGLLFAQEVGAVPGTAEHDAIYMPYTEFKEMMKHYGQRNGVTFKFKLSDLAPHMRTRGVIRGSVATTRIWNGVNRSCVYLVGVTVRPREGVGQAMLM